MDSLGKLTPRGSPLDPTVHSPLPTHNQKVFERQEARISEVASKVFTSSVAGSAPSPTNSPLIGPPIPKKELPNKGSASVHKVRPQSGVASSECGRILRGIEIFFLTILSAVFGKESSVGEYLQQRQLADTTYKEYHLGILVGKSVDAMDKHRNSYKNLKTPDKLMWIEGYLILKKDELKVAEGLDHTTAARLAVRHNVNLPHVQKDNQRVYEQVKTMNISKIGFMEPRVVNAEGKLVGNQGVKPTSHVLGLSDNERKATKDHLMNIYVLDLENGGAVIRSAKIDTNQKANDFMQVLEELHANNGNKPLRVVSHQLNSFENESKMIDGQHDQIARVDKKMGDKAEVIHINTASNRWYHYTQKFDSWGILGFIKAIFPKKLFKGEDLSKTQNLDSLGTYVNWVRDDIKSLLPSEDIVLLAMEGNSKGIASLKNMADASVENIEENKLKLKNDEGDKRFIQREIQNEKATLAGIRGSLKESLINDYKSLATLENSLEIAIDNAEGLAKQQSMEAFQKVSLMRQVLGSQLGVEKSLDRGQEGMMFQLLNDKLSVVAAMNCKSGLDRTGIWHAVKLSMLTTEKQIGADRSFTLVNEWDSTTTLMNAMTSRMKGTDHIGNWLNKDIVAWRGEFGNLIPKGEGGKELTTEEFEELRQKISDVILLRKEVLKSLIEVGIPITTASTGLMGLKWNSGLQENLIPLNFLPSHVNVNGGAKPALVKYDSNGEVSGISNPGRLLLNKFQALRGS